MTRYWFCHLACFDHVCACLFLAYWTLHHADRYAVFLAALNVTFALVTSIVWCAVVSDSVTAVVVNGVAPTWCVGRTIGRLSAYAAAYEQQHDVAVSLIQRTPTGIHVRAEVCLSLLNQSSGLTIYEMGAQSVRSNGSQAWAVALGPVMVKACILARQG